MKLFLNSAKCWIGAFFILGGICSVTTSISSALLGGTPKGEFIVESMLKTQTGGKFANAYGSRAVRKF